MIDFSSSGILKGGAPNGNRRNTPCQPTYELKRKGGQADLTA